MSLKTPTIHDHITVDESKLAEFPELKTLNKIGSHYVIEWRTRGLLAKILSLSDNLSASHWQAIIGLDLPILEHKRPLNYLRQIAPWTVVPAIAPEGILVHSNTIMTALGLYILRLIATGKDDDLNNARALYSAYLYWKRLNPEDHDGNVVLYPDSDTPPGEFATVRHVAPPERAISTIVST